MRPVPQLAADFVAAHEGCRCTAYADVGGIYTIGYGHTSGVKARQVCTNAQARSWLMDDLVIAAGRLGGVVAEGVILTLSDHQYAALLSFVFNCGAPRTATLFKVLNAGQLERVPFELMKWIYAGGKVVQGLKNRRDAEVALWLTPDTAPPREAVAPFITAGALPAPAPAVPQSANSGWVSRLWSRLA